jgi:ferric-dicitrate binding protein FerR (iron transport regulator)
MTAEFSKADRELAERAAQWVLTLLEKEMVPKARDEFAAWLKQSPRNTEEFLLAMAIWKQLDSLAPRGVQPADKNLHAE